MYNTESLINEIKEITKSGWFGTAFTIKPSIKRLLPVINRKDEELLYCQYSLFSSFGVGDLFLTQSRIIFLETANILNKDREIYLNNISSYSRSQGFNKLFAVEIVDSGGKTYAFKNLYEETANFIISSLEKSKDNNKNIQNGYQSTADELRKFAELMKEGLITEEEYNKKKAQILGQ